MSDDKLKSAYELAMERLEAKDRESGVDAPRMLSEAQKTQIAELRTEARAHLAQIEILYHDRRSAMQDPLELAQHDEHFTIDRRRIESDTEDKIERIKAGDSAGK